MRSDFHDLAFFLYRKGMPFEAGDLIVRLATRRPASLTKGIRGGGDPFTMMMVDSGILFIHVPKTGGISVKRALYGDINRGHGHVRAITYRTKLGKNTFNNLFKLAVVRNPWDRLVSAYHYLSQGGRNPRDLAWAARHLRHVTSFSDFVARWLNSRTLNTSQHFWPQHRFVCDSSGSLLVDEIWKLETLRQDMRRSAIANHIRRFPEKTNSSQRDEYTAYYDDSMRKKVGALYRKDINLFGYRFGQETMIQQAIKL